LRDEHVLGQRRDVAVEAELVAAVVRLARVGQHLHDDPRVEDGRAVLVRGSNVGLPQITFASG
jgi:hypothetical protein